MNEVNVKKEILDFLNRTNRSFTTRDAISFMALIRTTLEYQGNKGSWKIINFYCNWTLHTELSQTNYGHTSWVFDLLADAFNIHWGNNDEIIDAVARAVGLETMKNEMKAYLRGIFTIGELSEENALLNNDFWETITYLIQDRPVLNKKNNTGIYTSGKLNIINPQSNADVYISKIQLTAHLNTDSKEIAGLSIFVDPRPPLHTDDLTPFQIYQINKLS